jgi:hypothetical protein
MRARFIVRLLNEAHDLLSWTEVWAEAKPQDRAGSCPFWASAPTQFVIERDGIARLVTVHWADLDVARKQDLADAVPVSVGQVFNFGWLEPVWLVPGMRDVPLPGVTVRAPIAVGVPTGSLAAVSK